nr:hypothetical protein [Xanthomonadaceae bacterium]
MAVRARAGAAAGAARGRRRAGRSAAARLGRGLARAAGLPPPARPGRPDPAPGLVAGHAAAAGAA